LAAFRCTRAWSSRGRRCGKKKALHRPDPGSRLGRNMSAPTSAAAPDALLFGGVRGAAACETTATPSLRGVGFGVVGAAATAGATTVGVIGGVAVCAIVVVAVAVGRATSVGGIADGVVDALDTVTSEVGVTEAVVAVLTCFAIAATPMTTPKNTTAPTTIAGVRDRARHHGPTTEADTPFCVLEVCTPAAVDIRSVCFRTPARARIASEGSGGASYMGSVVSGKR